MMVEESQVRFLKKARKNFCGWVGKVRCLFSGTGGGDEGTPRLPRPPAKVFLVTFFSKKASASFAEVNHG
jgi:hypothetical protein